MIEIVTHCYCPKGIDQYAQHLKWQFSSLVLFPPKKTNITWTICYSTNDSITCDRVDRIMDQTGFQKLDWLTLQLNILKEPDLFRRAIGRNIAAKSTIADVIWFTDVDYYFGEECLDTVHKEVSADDELVAPRYVQISKDHWTGDNDLQINRIKEFPEPNIENYRTKKIQQAIGGVQILGGNVARRIGYLDGTKWMEPVSKEEGFRQCRGDTSFRRKNKFHTRKIEIPNIYRIRHTKNGRDFDK